MSADLNNPFSGESKLFFANKTDMDFKPLGIVEDSTKLCIEEEWEPVVKLNPTIFSHSFDFRCKNWKWLLWQERPSNLKYPNKKRKWRVKKKWFNRYEKPHYIGSNIKAEGRDAIVTNVTLRKCGGHNSTFTYTLESR